MTDHRAKPEHERSAMASGAGHKTTNPAGVSSS